MTTLLTNERLLDIWTNEFRTYLKQPGIERWRDRYIEQVRVVNDTPHDEWMKPDFQTRLWKDNPVANIGPGNSVTVTGALTDLELASWLFEAREAKRDDEASVRGARIDALYTRVLQRVAEKQHAKKQPKARLIRLLASLFPHDMACLMDANRLWQVHRLLGQHRVSNQFIAHHALLRQHLRSVLGPDDTIERAVEQSMLTWYLWDTYVKAPDQGAIESPKAVEAEALPEIPLLPVDSQRRGLPCVSANVALLVAIARETEHGLSREDLITTIVQEAPQLSSSTAAIIISQALGGLGLITLADGGYRPTTRGLDLLNAPDPREVLRGPLVGRVFGVGHLLLWLEKAEEGLAFAELSARLKALVPTWNSSQPGNYTIMWAKMVELIRPVTMNGVTRLVLTDHGEEYAEALPNEFEQRWKIRDDEAADAVKEIGAALPAAGGEADANANGPYSIQSIINEGCFVERQDLDTMLTLLDSKRNIILQGPPGTGKTWLAKRLGYALLGRKDASRLVSLQFQPSLSYEDFVRGWRPGADGWLDLIDGVFMEAIEEARSDQSRPYVVVIEEINRGNPAQVFGEMLTLLERDKRKEEEALRPAYVRAPDERIFIPENLYVIGTMNVADRSLALIDLALRRRFAYFPLKPEVGDRWRDWCMKENGFSKTEADDIAERMRQLNKRIADDESLNEQFCIGHSFVTPAQGEKIDNVRAWFARVVESEIKPLLREYWFDNQATAEDACKKLLANLEPFSGA
ncbi:GTPase subunit of restriction endonuclease-like protein [Caballeronia fortuita]|uniref:GTPase subunit of restriction endonuclease-like protein n=1 Tax=Caballeronia fortuita TaxID=1777138 RepID=A0A157Z4Z2_9BURK|nr:AAA family ATPase [Caballeronia fortuita]SAK40656.1 GTPase subunit of restriction endonuclease-like protein [Caballeronia fortuita]